MDPSNINFKLLSLNARGIRSFEKRKALYGWLMKDKSDICFLQESYSTPEVEKICAFCNAEEESLEHLLYLCKISSFFWKELLSWIAVEANIVLNASLLDILFGKFDLEKDFLLVNHIFLLAKYFIYKCKLSQVIPTLLVFKAKLKATYKVELYIAKEKGILPNHYKKWDNFLSWLS